MESHYPIHLISENYTFLEDLGQGCYGHVIKCLKQDTEDIVAVKVLKHSHSKIKNIREIMILEKLRCLDPDKSNIVRCYNWFHRLDRTFMVFENLDISVHDYMCKRKWAPLPLHGIRTIIKDVATALNAMKSVGLIHTDLKLDNIMLVNHQKQPFRVRLIDFGLTLFKVEARRGLIVQPLCHRSPEILLGLPFTEAIDIWSLGSLMAQMLLGFILFPGTNKYDVLRFIVELLGEPPKGLLNKGYYTGLFYRKSRKYGLIKHWTFKTPLEFYRETGIKPEDTRRHRLSSLDEINMRNIPNQESRAEAADSSASVELLKEMLQIIPRKRITPSKILAHPFIMGIYFSLSNRSLCEASPGCPIKLAPGVIIVKSAQKTMQREGASKQSSDMSSQAEQKEKANKGDLRLESISDSVQTSLAVASDIESILLVSPNELETESPDSTLKQASNIIDPPHMPGVSERKKQKRKTIRQLFSTLLPCSTCCNVIECFDDESVNVL